MTRLLFQQVPHPHAHTTDHVSSSQTHVLSHWELTWFLPLAGPSQRLCIKPTLGLQNHVRTRKNLRHHLTPYLYFTRRDGMAGCAASLDNVVSVVWV